MKINPFLKKMAMYFYCQILVIFLFTTLVKAIPTSGQNLHDVKVSITANEASVAQVFSMLEKRTGFAFFYSSADVSKLAKVSIDAKGASLNDVLENLAKQANFRFKQFNHNIAVTRMMERQIDTTVQQRKVTGIVIDALNGKPLPGVSIIVEGSTVGVITDMDGHYAIMVPNNNSILVFSFLGYLKERIELLDKNTFNVSLNLDIKTLNETVVVGYGTQKKVNLTGAVDQISGDKFQNRPLTNLTQGIQGLIPNLNIVLKDGKPTQSPSYNIRGTTSIGQGGSALVLIDGVEGDPSMINPNDVASISVLKDASSASIYGARGAFGVVLITTKKPENGKMHVTYTVNHSIKQPTALPDMVTEGYQWASMFNDAWSAWNDYSQTPQNVNKTQKFSQEYLAELKRRSEDPSLPRVEVNSNGEYVYYYSTDWYKELYKNSTYSNEHNLSFSGSSDKTTFSVTGRYYGQEGLFRYNSDDYSIYNLRAKGTVQLSKWFQIEDNAEYSDMKYHNPLNVGEGGSIWRNIADEGHSMAPMFNPDGTLSYSAAYTVGDFWYGKNGMDTYRKIFKNTTGFTAKLIDDKWRVKGDFTFQNKDNDQKTIRVPVPYSRVQGVIAYVGTNYNDIQNSNKATQYLATNLYTEYETHFGESHYLKAMVGYNYEQSTYKALSVTRNGLIFSNAEDINMALGQSITTSGGWEKWDILGGFFRVNYAFKDRYLLEVNGRYDGSSKFPENSRYAFFPSVSGGWRVSKESFWHLPQDIISDLKIRASYGSLGNGSIGSYAFQEKFNIAQSSRVLNGVKPQYTNFPNVLPDGLTWEVSTTRNVGLDLAALSNRFQFNGDAYIRKTADMYTKGMTLPAVFGTDVPKGNYADLKTVGWEFSLSWHDQFGSSGKPFGYDIRLTLADYQSKITKYNNPDKNLGDYYVGQTVGEIWGYETEGLFTSTDDIASHANQNLIIASSTGKILPGDVKFKDLNDDHVINYGKNTLSDHGDIKVIGNSTPRYTYGINLGANWDNFFFSTFFQGVGKQDWWPGTEADAFWGQYNRPYNNPLKSQLGHIWSENNQDAYFPRYKGYVAQTTLRELGVTQTRYLQNVAYLRLKNIQIGYNIPQKIINRLRISSARIYLSGENLFTWSPMYKITKHNIDIENIGASDLDLTSGTSGNGNNYPFMKSVTAGLSISL